jgi:glycosyltransferase involved in cell wall biosynthesis
MIGRVLIDTSNLRAGGGLQVGSSFLDELAVLARDEGSRWPWLASVQVEASQEILENCVQDLSPLNVSVVVDSPIRRVLRGPRRRDLDVHFTVFGPDYSFSRARRRLVGFADVTSLRPEYALAGSTWAARRRHMVRRRTSRFLFTRAHGLVVEAEHVADDLTRRWGVPPERLSVVPNVVNGAFHRDPQVLDIPGTGHATFCYPTRAYPHKNLGLLGPAATFLWDSHGIEVRFVLTLTAGEWEKLSPETRSWSVNVGPLRVSQMPALYRACSGTVFSSLNECFSVTPLEALSCSSPLVASNRHFVREVAGEAAVYFDPHSPQSLGDALRDVLVDPMGTRRRVQVGNRIAAAWPRPSDRARAYLDLISGQLESLGGATSRAPRPPFLNNN